VTPTLRAIKEAYPDVRIMVNTNYPDLLRGNPYVDQIGADRRGLFLGYPDPIHRKNPEKHHILSDWEIVSKAFGLDLPEPVLKPEIYISLSGVERADVIGVQVMHKGHWHAKKVWPHFEVLARAKGFEAIPEMPNVTALVRRIASYKAVVCAEGGISHIAKAIGVAAVVIYGGFADPAWNGYPDQVNITNRLPCSYCYNPDPCTDRIERRCMRDISVSRVLMEVQWIKE
jgi:hypothetical protein